MILEPHWKPTYGPCLRRLLGALLLALATSCSTTSTAPSQEPTRPEENCLELAEPLTPLADKEQATVIRKLVEVADLYHQLAARHRCLASFERGRR